MLAIEIHVDLKKDAPKSWKKKCMKIPISTMKECIPADLSQSTFQDMNVNRLFGHRAETTIGGFCF